MSRRRRSASCAAAAVAIALLVTRCGASPSSPGPPGPTVIAVSPGEGPVVGGTRIQISGANFAPGAVVTVGGVSATDVVVESFSSITAKTGPAREGPADVAVTVDGRAGTLPGGFHYVPVSGEPPVVMSIVARGTRPNEPPRLAEPGEEIIVTATVQDPDTPPEQLVFQWSADVGTFAETGAVVKWTAPADSPTPSLYTLSLTVSDATGNSTSSSTTVAVHSSEKEVGDLAREFLLDFSDSNKPAAFVVRNFSKSPRCEAERDSEFTDVDNNRHDYHIDSSNIGTPTVTFQFGGFPCSYLSRPGDACAVVPSSWQSTCLPDARECKAGEKYNVSGLDYVTASYEGNDWRLCASYFKADGTARRRFIR